ncbi:MAG: SUF system Fe-S cluster assembly protein [Pseudomonadota bacterium]
MSDHEKEQPHAPFGDAPATAPTGDAGQAEVAPPTPPAPPSVADGGTPVDGTSLSREELDQLTSDIIAAVKTVYDPEIPVDIYELGLIYEVDVDDERNVAVDMTLTAPGCPVAGEMPIWVENAIAPVPGVQSVKVNLTFDPPWDMSRMSDEARVALNMF